MTARALALALVAGVALLGPGEAACPAPRPPTAPAARPYAREDPFVVRPFRSELHGRWIGDALAYGPHRDGQRPGGPSPTDAQLRADLALLAPRWHLLRLYDASPTALAVLRVIRHDRLPVRVLLGVGVGAETRSDSAGRVVERFPAVGAANRRQVEAAVRACRAYPEIVLGLSAGNETQIEWSALRVPESQLVATLRELRARTRVPVTTGDDFNYWNKPRSRAVAGEVDFVLVHLHPLWNGASREGALAWLSANLDSVRARHPDRDVVIGETGWATRRNDEGDQGRLMKGAVGETEQAAYQREVSAWAGSAHVTTFWFEAFDENWKGGPDPADVEKHWGLYRADRSPKLAAAPTPAPAAGDSAP